MRNAVNSLTSVQSLKVMTTSFSFKWSFSKFTVVFSCRACSPAPARTAPLRLKGDLSKQIEFQLRLVPDSIQGATYSWTHLITWGQFVYLNLYYYLHQAKAWRGLCVRLGGCVGRCVCICLSTAKLAYYWTNRQSIFFVHIYACVLNDLSWLRWFTVFERLILLTVSYRHWLLTTHSS